MTPIPIGPYDKNARPPLAHHHLDDYGMARLNWNSNPGDSLGGNQSLFFAYNDRDLIGASSDMWYFNSKGKYVGQRHPILPPEDNPMSRDHYVSTLMILKLDHIRNGTKSSMDKIKEMTDETGYIISKMARRGFGLAWWSKAIQGKKFYQFLWHMMEIVSALFVYLPVFAVLSTIAKFGPEVEQEDYVPYPDGLRLQDLPKYKQWISVIMYPSYALKIGGWQLYVVKGFPVLRKIHQLVYLPMIAGTNYVQQMLYGVKDIPRQKIESFKPMSGGRWSGHLSSRNDRNMRVLDPPPIFNNVDADIARMLYNETQL